MIDTRKKGRWLVVIQIITIILYSCNPEKPEALIEIETGDIEETGPTHCIINGEILNVGERGINQHGFVWSESPDPTLQSGTIIGLGTSYAPGIFTSTISGLSPNTTYYVKAYATGVGQIEYGTERSFTTTEPTAPLLHTIPAFVVGTNSAVAGGEIYGDGGAEILARGVCWSTHNNPRLTDNYSQEGPGSGSFESEMGDLEPFTIYFFRAYAINDIGTSYGEKFGFKTRWDNSTIEDMEGNVYNTVQIGEQVWMAENLRSAQFPDGDPIPLVETPEEWFALNSDQKALCYYENSSAAFETYGALYTWSAAMNGSESNNELPGEVQGVCPDGWHLPSENDWRALESHLGLSDLYIREDGWRGWDEGGMLKQTGTALWVEPNLMATNESGFSGIPGGFRDADGSFLSGGSFSAFWSSTGYDNDGAWLRGLHSGRGEILRDVYPRKDGFSVRCIKD